MAAIARALVVAACLAAAAVAGCRDDAGRSADVSAVATTTQVADLVRNVGGGRVDVDGILPPNADPHGYEPRPSDAAALSRADVVFRSGGDVDAWLHEVIDAAGGDARQMPLIEAVDTLPGDGDEADPHWWQDPLNAVRAVGAIRAALVEADPAGRAGYDRRAAAYVRRLRRLDREVRACLDRVPARQRKLVTTHDALAYFAHRYGVEVIGAVIPSLSTQAQPSAKDVDRLVRQIRDERVAAIFPEAAVSQKLEQAISREAGARVGGTLWTDTLGPEGSDGATYVDSIRSNARTLAEGMSRGRVSCELS